MVALSTSAPTFIAFRAPLRCRTLVRHHNRLHCFRLRAQLVAAPSISPAANALKLLEWGKVVDAVASFASTNLGREATKAQLWEVDVSFEESKVLLRETSAAVEFIKQMGEINFFGVDTALVKTAVRHASRGYVLDGKEAVAVVKLVQSGEALQLAMKSTVKEDADWYERLMPLSQLVLEAPICHSFVKFAQNVVDEDGSVKDNASFELRKCREQVQALDRKIHQLMSKLLMKDKNVDFMELGIVNGRYCITSVGDHVQNFDGLLLSSGSGTGYAMEPMAVIPLNDELQQARALVAREVENILTKLTEKLVADLDDVQTLLRVIIKIDVMTARAKYGIAYNSTPPDISFPDKSRSFTSHGEKFHGASIDVDVPLSDWSIYMLEAYHPVLLQQYREKLDSARKNLAQANAEIRRITIYGKKITDTDSASQLESLKVLVSQLEKDHPVPIDFMVRRVIKGVVISGPNTGGKTVSLKTIGLASLMAKTGLYVLAREPVILPWFDAIYANIGDDQSLTQSLSTFSGHLKQIGAILSCSTPKSLVLLDEVGAGTNPLEGAALGMALLESFECQSFLTIVTTHHGELKTLKYSNKAFENACVEFDEEKLKPTFRILWGVPGRSNAINIAEKLGLPPTILEYARKLHGTENAEINEVIVDMEKLKQKFREHLQGAQHYLQLTKKLYCNLLGTQLKVEEYALAQNSKKLKAISEAAVVARSVLCGKMQKCRESMVQDTVNDSKVSQISHTERLPALMHENSEKPVSLQQKTVPAKGTPATVNLTTPSGSQKEIPKIGSAVYVPTIGKQATVLNVDPFKEEVLVQAGGIKLRLKLKELKNADVGHLITKPSKLSFITDD